MIFHFTGQARGAFGPGGFVIVWLGGAGAGGPVFVSGGVFIPIFRPRRR